MSEQEFCEMIPQYEKLVYTICFQFTKNHHTAQDLAQESFLSAYAHRASCPEEAAKAWVCRIATNKCKDYLKSAYHRRVSPAFDEMPEHAAPVLCSREQSPEEKTQSREISRQIARTARELPPLYAQVAELHFGRQLSAQEISRLLSRPLKTVQTQLYRAKHQLRRALTEQGITPESCLAV